MNESDEEKRFMLFAGSAENNSIAKKLLYEKKAELVIYPVHQTCIQFEKLCDKNNFGIAIPFYCREFGIEKINVEICDHEKTAELK